MNIYQSTKVIPYVYQLVHKETGQFYIGFRCANKVPSSEDLGTRYFSSSRFVKELGFENFDYQILAEFFEKDDAYSFEQELILEHWGSQLLNKCYVFNKFNGSFLRTKETKRKMSAWQIGRTLPNETKNKISKALMGKKCSKETKIRLKTMNLGKKHSPRSNEWKIKQRNSHLGRKDSTLTLFKKSKAQSGENNSRCKNWLILSEYGLFLELRDIKNWCKNKKMNADMFKNTRVSGKFIKGWTMIEEIII